VSGLYIHQNARRNDRNLLLTFEFDIQRTVHRDIFL